MLKYNLYEKICVYIKMVNKSYQKHKEKLRKKARERYLNLSQEEKDKRQDLFERLSSVTSNMGIEQDIFSETKHRN